MTYKDRFLQTPAAKSHFELTATEHYKTAVEHAILQHVSEFVATDDPVKAAANFHRISGAMQFAKTLTNLGTKVIVEPSKPLGNLDHKEK